MQKIILLVFICAVFAATAFGHQAFTLVSSQKRTVSEAELVQFEKGRSVGKREGFNLTFTEKDIRVVVTTGPADDMLSYRIQGVRNPTMVVPAGATLRILFVNSDTDMRHDIRLGHVVGDFPILP